MNYSDEYIRALAVQLASKLKNYGEVDTLIAHASSIFNFIRGQE